MVWRPLMQPTEALVRMVSPSPSVNEDKVSHGGEGGPVALTHVIPTWKPARLAGTHWQQACPGQTQLQLAVGREQGRKGW